MVFYTDGACSGNTGNGGWCYVQVFEEEQEIRTDFETGAKENTTNNEMELTAVYKALVKSLKEGYKEVIIFCDSAYVVNAITKNWLLNWYKNGWQTAEGKPVKNKKIWEKMYKIIYASDIKIKLNHINGHNGDPLNELADRLAVKAKEEQR